MATLGIHLTQAMREQYEKPGVWVDAVYFHNGTAHWTTLVKDGSAVGSQVNVDLPSVFNSGKVYLLVHSGEAGLTTDPLPGIIAKESDINIGSAQANNIRFDSVELTLGMSQSDQGNLTSVIGFGLPMNMSVSYTDGSASQSVGYNLTGNAVFEAIQAIHPDNAGLVFNFTQGPLEGEYRFGTAPASGNEVSPVPFSATDWKPYLQALQGQSGTLAELAGFYNGSPDANNVWHNQGFYHYTLESDGNDFWLVPQANSQIQGHVRITLDELANSIYATNGSAQVFASQTATDPFQFYDPVSKSMVDSMNVGANNQWGKLFTELITGFSGGMWGGLEGKAVNPEITDTVDLGQSWNWEPNYAFGENVSGKPAGWHVDPYSKIFFDSTNSYGSMYSDNLMDGYSQGGPLVDLVNIETLSLTLFGDAETPTGYTAPVVNNYLAGGGSNGQYAVAGTAYSDINIGLNLALVGSADGTTSWVVDDSKAKLTVDVLTGYDSAGKPQWTPVTLDSSVAGANDSLWWNWSVQYDAGSQTFKAVPSANTEQPDGSLVLTGLPVASDGVGWYRVTLSDTSGGASKTFNLYTTTSGGQFVFDGTQQAIDGGAIIAMPGGSGNTIGTFAVNLLSGSSTYVHPDLLTPGGGTGATAMIGTAAVPVVLRHTDSGAVVLPGQDSLTAADVTTVAGTDTAGLLSFGWTGTNDAAETANWISAYTNKVGALDIVRIDVHGDKGHTYLTTQADLDGEWLTPGHHFDAGSYTVTMRTYDAADTDFKHALSEASHAVTLDVTAGAGGGAPAPRLESSGGTLALDTGLGEATGMAARLYQGALDRAPDPVGLGYWMDAIDTGALTWIELAWSLLHSAEFVQQHGSVEAMAPEAFIDLVYDNLFERVPDAEGLAWWTDALAQGDSQAEVLLAITESMESWDAFDEGMAHGVWFA